MKLQNIRMDFLKNKQKSEKFNFLGFMVYFGILALLISKSMHKAVLDNFRLVLFVVIS